MILSAKQKEYIKKANRRYNFKIGARRCGKTFLDNLYVNPAKIIELKDKDGLNVFLGVSRGTIERNVLQPLRELYGKHKIGEINSENIAVLFGQPVYCLGAEKKNQVSKLQGTSIKYLYGDEVARWNPEVFEMIKASLDKPYSQMHGALNPENKNHWFKKTFLDKIETNNIDAYIQYYTIFDNPFLDKDFVRNICNDYQGTVYYNRYILGQWTDAEGIIFKAIANDHKRFITKNISSGIITIGLDWGGNKSAHSITATIMDYDFKKLQYIKSDKLIATGTDTNVIFRWAINFIKEIQQRYGTISYIFPDSAEQVLNNSLKTALDNEFLNIPVEDCSKIPIEDRIHLLNILHNSDRISYIDNECSTLIEAMQTALFDEKAPRDRWIDDGETSDIDSLDSACYSWTWFYKHITLN